MKMIGIGVVLVVLGFAGGTIFSGKSNYFGGLSQPPLPLFREWTNLPEISGGHCKEFKYHFLVVHDRMMSDISRQVEIFMDPAALNEENLVDLFTFVSEDVPEPLNLTVVVRTEWNHLSLPRKHCPGYGTSRSGRTGSQRNATFYRRKGVEYFRYRDAKENWTERTVILKGDGTADRLGEPVNCESFKERLQLECE